ncbi:hypothetical protein PtA15_7A229 [Puccinia triticina]|uniref:PhoD-like phosphatase domain-containing protein n=1 Tax=Puccinia triticina TaxID=208348 RepID=A0ABY7CQ90_9BASI|nr:uncharacterized protein PtA15_7A229 [Puccinia triticina]WAQ86503.1 hypothetical protein PtA15_7A229 [Puccinia triticina]
MDEQGLRARYRAEKQEKAARASHYGGLHEPKPLPDDLDDLSPDDYPAPSHLSSQAEYSSDPAHQAQHLTITPSTSSASRLPPGSPSTTKRALRPHLQFMCGPMLRYDSVDLHNNTWLGFCCVVTADTGSVYEPSPMLQMQWNSTFDSSPDPSQLPGSTIQQDATADRIYVYHGPSDSYSFWRFRLVIPMGQRETRVRYSINHGAQIAFYVPAVNQNFRWAAHSCNGFSAGVDQSAFNGPDPVWNDLLDRHKALPFHVMIGGGDQLYCDPIAKEPELSGWLQEKDQEVKKTAQMTQPMSVALDRFFFSHYCNWFRSGAFGKAISCIPMINMLDDHDLIDGFGSYPPDLQSSPVFSAIGNRGYFWFLLFQLFVVDKVDGITETSPTSLDVHPSLVLGTVGPYIHSRNHSILSYLGPQAWILLLDCRSERMKNQICSPETYRIVFEACRDRIPAGVGHLVVQLGIPIVYPRMVFAEKILEKPDRLVFKAIRKLGVIPGFYNNFNADPELLDDMNDHWCAQSHKQERNWFIIECQNLALILKLRITFLSGDVHCAAVGRLFTHGKQLKPDQDPKYMLNIVSSAIVNTPPPAALISMMGALSRVTHKTLSSAKTAEDMVDLFKFDTNGKSLKNQRFMPRRNYCAVRVVDQSGEMEFNIRVEIEQGQGKTKGYPVLVPPPNYSPAP